MPDNPPARIEYTDIAKEHNGKWQHLVEYCLDLHAEIKKSEYRNKKITEIEESTKCYEQIEQPTNDPWPGASNIILPLTTISSDNLEPRLVSGLVGKTPYVRFEMESDQEQDEQTEILEGWYNEELEDGVKIKHTTGGIVHTLQKEGTVYPLPRYDFDEVMRRDFVVQGEEQDPEMVAYLEAAGAVSPLGGVWVDANGDPITIDRVETPFEGVKVELVPFKDVFIPDDSDDWEKTPIIRKVYPTYAELMRDSEEKNGFMNIGKWLLKEETDRKLDQERQSPGQSIQDARVTAKEVIECIECSISYIYQNENEEKEDIEDWTEERLVALIALEKRIILRLLPLREVNFKNEHLLKRIRLFPEQGLSYGTSLYGKLRSIQKGASKTFNLAINIAEVVMIPWFLFTDKVGLKGKVKLKPGEGVPVDSVDGLYFPRFNINPSQMIDFIYLFTSFWEKLLSIGDLQVGRPAESRGKKTTATEVISVIQEGNVKHNYQAGTIKEEFLTLLRTIYDLYYQYMPLEKTFLWNGNQVPISRVNMKRPYKFRLSGSTELSNKFIERKEKEDLYSLLGENPVANPIKSTKELVKSYGHTDEDQWVDPTINQIIQAIQEIPGAGELFQESLEQAQALAEQMQETGKAAAESVVE